LRNQREVSGDSHGAGLHSPHAPHIAATNTQKVKMATLDRLDGPRTGPI
jgi:hypothetical protein